MDERGQDGDEIGAEPIGSDAWLHTKVRPVAVSKVPRIGPRIDPEVGRVRHVEIARRDADHSHRDVAEAHPSTDDLGIAPVDVAPHAIGHDGHAGALEDMVGGREPVSERHRQAEDVEETFARRVHLGEQRRAVVAKKGRLDSDDAGRAYDRRPRLIQRSELDRRDQAAREASVREALADRVEILVVRIRKRAQRRGAHRAEHRRRRADAEREGHDGRQREGRRSPKRSKGVEQVVDQCAKAL